MGIAVIAGALPADGNGAFLTRSAAERLWPNGGALNQSVHFWRYDYRVVGIVPDFVQGSLSNSGAGGLIDLRQSLAPESIGTGVTGIPVIVGTVSDAEPLVPAVEKIVSEIFPHAARSRVATGRRLLESDMARERLGASFFTGFGLVSLILGVAGVFGLVAYLVESSARDLGVRLALGATSNGLMRIVMATSVVPVIIGAAAGLLVAVLMSETVTAMLHGTSRLDAVSYAGPACLMVASAVVSAFLAALRVRRLSPMDALRTK